MNLTSVERASPDHGAGDADGHEYEQEPLEDLHHDREHERLKHVHAQQPSGQEQQDGQADQHRKNGADHGGESHQHKELC